MPLKELFRVVNVQRMKLQLPPIPEFRFLEELYELIPTLVFLGYIFAKTLFPTPWYLRIWEKVKYIMRRLLYEFTEALKILWYLVRDREKEETLDNPQSRHQHIVEKMKEEK